MRKEIMKLITLGASILGCSSSSPRANNIELYNAYGNEHQLILHGRMVKKEAVEEVTKADSGYKNLWNTLDFFHRDEIKNRAIFLHVNGEKYVSRGDDEGYFDFDVITQKRLDEGYVDLSLQIEKNPHLYSAQATIITAQKPLLGIISDIDDTVVISDVTNKTELLLNIFWKNYKQRELIPTMVERFEKILTNNPPAEPSRLFFLSGSPQHLFTSIENFLSYHHFPKHVMILKQLHGEGSDPLFDQLAYKKEKIEELFALYPKMQWIMFGDSGEKDQEVYESISKQYPSKVKGYYIRDVESGEIVFFETTKEP